jgi:hypothetical protein
MSSFKRIGLATVAFVAIESTVFTVGQFNGPPRLIWILSLVLGLCLTALLARELRSSLGAGTDTTGHSLMAILLAAVIATGAFFASVLIAITITARLGGPL